MNRIELIEKAKEVFASHPSEARLVATTDGQFRSLTIDHAHKSGEETLILERSEVTASGKDNPKEVQLKSKKQNQ